MSLNNKLNGVKGKPLTSLLQELQAVFRKIREGLEDVIVEKAHRTLDEILDIRGIVEVGGSSEELLASLREVVENTGEIGFESSLVFIDSSSRSIGFNPLRVTISAVAVKTRRGLVVEPYNIVNWRFIAVKSIRPVLERIEKTSNIIRVRNPCGVYYDEEYKDDNIGDELRLDMENRALRELVPRDHVVVLDGPVYPTPEVIFYSNNNKYAKAFLELIKKRLEIIHSMNTLVLGFVKRTEYSRKLWRNNEVRRLIKDLTGKEISNVPDPVIVEYIVEKKVRPRIGEWWILGPFYVRYDSKLLEPKAFYYIARRTIHGYNVYRVEVLEKDYSGMREVVEKIIAGLLENTSLRGIPLGIELVDKASRKTTAALYLLLREYLSGILSIAYDELGREADIMRELEE